jgi:DNA-binding HxlR family transcriptional regulator
MPNTANKPVDGKKPKGIRLGGGVTGKYLFRIRQQHIADHLIPLMRERAWGAAKLDLLLRCVGLAEEHAGPRPTGFVLPGYSWEKLHNLVRAPGGVGAQPSDLDAPPEVVRLKRKWVGAQLARLEALGLVRRIAKKGRRPELLVLSDSGSGKPLDDPGAQGDSYVTILGGTIASGNLASWRAPELSAYLAATVAERLHPPSRKKEGTPPLGGGQWFRSLGWFADQDQRYELTARVIMPFSPATLERGISRLEKEELITRTQILHDPRNGNRLQGPRNLYRNRFDRLASEAISATAFAKAVKEKS